MSIGRSGACMACGTVSRNHEPLLSYDIAGRVTDAVNVATLIDAELGQHLAATSQVGLLLVQRPR